MHDDRRAAGPLLAFPLLGPSIGRDAGELHELFRRRARAKLAATELPISFRLSSLPSLDN